MDKNLAAVRRILLALLLFGLLGTGVDLVLLSHYENPWQLIPLGLITIAIIVIAWHAVNRGRASIRVLQVAMVLFIMSGLAGFFFHYQGNKEFQLEVNPSLGGLELFLKVIQAKAPPALAPGAMIHLGLLGLAYSYRHPALVERASSTTTITGA